MIFFGKKPTKPACTPDIDTSVVADDRVEIEVAKEASAEAKRKVEKVNSQFKELIRENGFHVKIYLAAGGKPRGGHK